MELTTLLRVYVCVGGNDKPVECVCGNATPVECLEMALLLSVFGNDKPVECVSVCVWKRYAC